MLFALAHQSKRNASIDSKMSTPAKHTSIPHNHINNLNEDSPSYILHLQRAIGNHAVQRKLHSHAEFDFAKNGIQPKLKISQPNDEYEQEANRVAEQIMRISGPLDSMTRIATTQGKRVGRKCTTCEMEEKEEEEKLNINRKPSAYASNIEANDQVTNEISSFRTTSGSSLDSLTKEFMGSKFGYDFTDVRIHTGVMAGRSAQSVNALAYTVGKDIVFGEGQYQPNTLEGRRLLTHELTHVLQQQEMSLSTIQRQARQPLKSAPSSSSASSSRTFEQVWQAFQVPFSLSEEERDQLALEALDLMVLHHENALKYGLPLANYLFQRGKIGPAQRALVSAHSAWKLASSKEPNSVLTPYLDSLKDLIGQAESLARADQHTLAFQIFGTAFEMLQFQLQVAGPTRMKELPTDITAGEAKAKRETAGLGFYPDVSNIYELMRRILGFYGTLEAEQRAAGNRKSAAIFNGLSLQLYREILDKYLLDDESKYVIAEVERVTKGKGEALRIFGKNSVDIDVTQLPGLPSPKEVVEGTGSNFTFQRDTMTDITKSLFGQTELLAELSAESEIRKGFRGQTIDLNNLKDRLKVWSIMYRVYQKQDTLGLGALHRLMRLIGRYLQAFTVHTEFNVDDLGASYLANNMENMPVDLVGRIERDCGVYALTVAYEVFRTVRSTSSPLRVKFRLFPTLDHVILVIFDESQKNYYIVNNNEISPPKEGKEGDARVYQDVAERYAGIRGMENIVTPALEIKLGSTDMSDKEFREKVWKRYRDSVRWGLDVEPPPAGSSLTPGQMAEKTYHQFYEFNRELSEKARILHSAIDSLTIAVRSMDRLNRLGEIRKALDTLSPRALRLKSLFMELGPNAKLEDTAGGNPTLIKMLRSDRRFLYTSFPPGRSHILVRLAKVLMHFQSLGGVLSDGQQEFIKDVNLIKDFHSELKNYEFFGKPAAF